MLNSPCPGCGLITNLPHENAYGCKEELRKTLKQVKDISNKKTDFIESTNNGLKIALGLIRDNEWDQTIIIEYVESMIQEMGLFLERTKE